MYNSASNGGHVNKTLSYISEVPAEGFRNVYFITYLTSIKSNSKKLFPVPGIRIFPYDT